MKDFREEAVAVTAAAVAVAAALEAGMVCFLNLDLLRCLQSLSLFPRPHLRHHLFL